MLCDVKKLIKMACFSFRTIGNYLLSAVVQVSSIYLFSITKYIQNRQGETYPELGQISKMDLSVKIINFRPFTVLAKTQSLMFDRVLNKPLGQHLWELISGCLMLWPVDHSTLVSLYIFKFKESIVIASIYVSISITKCQLQNPT